MLYEGKKSSWIALGSCALVSGFLFFGWLDRWDFWGDEMNTVHDVQQGISYIWNGVRWHPPLYLVLAWGWTHLWGLDEITLRFISALSAMVSFYLIYFLGREWLGERYGLTATFLLTTSPFCLLFSRMARYYSLAMMLALASFFFFWKAIHRGERKDWLGYTLSVTLLLYTFYPGLAVLLGNALFLWWYRAQYKGVWKQWGWALGIILICWAPLFVNLPGNTAFVASHESAELAQNWKGLLFKLFYTAFAFGLGETISPANWPIVFPATLLETGILIRGWKLLRAKGFQEIRTFLILHLLVAMAFVLLVTSTVAKFEIASHFPTLIMFVFPLFLLLIAAPFGLAEGNKGLGMLIALVLLNAYGIHNYFWGKQFHNPQFVIPWRNIALTIHGSQKQGDTVFASDSQLFYYCPDLRAGELRTAVKHIPSLKRFWLVERDRGQRNLVELTRETRQEALKQGFRCVWRQHYVPLDPRDVWLKEKILGRPVARWNVTVECYERSAHPGNTRDREHLYHEG